MGMKPRKKKIKETIFWVRYYEWFPSWIRLFSDPKQVFGVDSNGEIHNSFFPFELEKDQCKK